MPRLPQPMIPMRMRSLAPMLRCAVLASTPRGATSDTAPAAAIDARKSRRDCVDMLIVRLLVGAVGRLRDSDEASSVESFIVGSFRTDDHVGIAERPERRAPDERPHAGS